MRAFLLWAVALLIAGILWWAIPHAAASGLPFSVYKSGDFCVFVMGDTTRPAITAVNRASGNFYASCQ